MIFLSNNIFFVSSFFRHIGFTGSWGILAQGGVELGKGQFGYLKLPDFLSTIFILTHIYLINATNKHFKSS